jgi:CheY-like chemotaxis protein
VTLLIVDGDKNDLLFLEKEFKKIDPGYRIHTCKNGQEAVAFLKHAGKDPAEASLGVPTHIISDVKMVRGDGFRLAGKGRGRLCNKGRVCG